MSEKVIKLVDYLKNRDPGNKITKDDIKELVKIEEKDIARLSSIFFFARYTLFLKTLFYRNHDKKGGRNPNTGFMVGFHEDHLLGMRDNCRKTLSSMKRSFREVDATNKTFIQIVNELTNEHGKSNWNASEAIKKLLYYSDKVIIITNFSRSKIKSKGKYVRSLIKILDDAHFHKIFPISDLIFIDYAGFLQRVWPDIGYCLSILTYSDNEMEFDFSHKTEKPE